MEQKSIRIGKIEVPIIIDGDEEWFPISLLCEKVLLRKGRIKFNSKYTNFYEINYGHDTGGIQKVKCVSKNGINDYSQSIMKGRMDVNQSRAFNELMSYLNIHIAVSEDAQFIHKPSEVIKNKLNSYELDCYHEIKDVLNDDCWQRCSKCDVYYPFHINFFRENQSSPSGLNTFCRNCSWNANRLKDCVQHVDKELESVYKKYGEDIYLIYKNHETIDIYKHYINNEMSRYPEILKNKEDYIIILKHLHVCNLIDMDNLNIEYFIEAHRLLNIRSYLTLHEVYQILFGDTYYLTPWKHKRVPFENMTYEIANQILNNYISEFNVEIKDNLMFDYTDILKKSRLIKFTNGDMLYFLVQFYNFEYAGYLFKTKSPNYYKNEQSVLFDLKYLIEKDMKINIEKIPLYLTKFNLQKRCSPLYNYIISKKNGSLFDWVDKLYPDKLCVQDFEINSYRNEFDSDTEAYIHEILIEEFGGNVIYNQRSTHDTVKLKGKIPDWFLFTDKGVWVIEYFGMLDEKYSENSRIRDYKVKTQNKINLYKEMNDYNFLYLYPNDIEDGFQGCREKFEKIKQTIDT